MALSCGIDFGTSNSVCALVQDSQPVLVPLEMDKVTLPSALFFGADKSLSFGRTAIAHYIEGEDGRLMRNLKMILGTSLMHEKTLINRDYKSFKEILEIYLAHIKSHAERQAGCAVESVVMGRPVFFHEDDDGADKKSENTLRDIAKTVGFKNIDFGFEPIAAAFAHEQNLTEEKLALVVDLGGGTSDFTVIRLSPEAQKKQERHDDILATAGVRVGGTHFDTALSMKDFMPHLGLGSYYEAAFEGGKRPAPNSIYAMLSDWAQVHFAYSHKEILETEKLYHTSHDPEKIEALLAVQQDQLGHAFLQKTEQCKIALTHSQDHITSFSDLGFDFTVDSTRAHFEHYIADKIEKIAQTIDLCLTKASVTSEKIDLIILTGGSTELPIINKIVSEKFPYSTLSKDDKFGSVGLGLGYYAKRVFGG